MTLSRPPVHRRGCAGARHAVRSAALQCHARHSFAPFGHGVLVQSQPLSDDVAGFALGTGKHNPGALNQAMWQGA